MKSNNRIVSSAKAAVLGVLFFLFSNVNAQLQVADLDSGVDPDAGLNLGEGFNYFDNISDTTDRSPDTHGTISAMLIAEAFSGQIVPFVITAADGEGGSQSTVARDNALSDVLGRNNVRVVGITRGRTGVTGTSSALIPQLTDANKVVAILASNDFASQPNALATSSFNLPGVVIVGGTDFNGDLLPQSNRAGTTANKFVTAIGLPSEDFTGPGGSSWATARITGIAGAVLQQNPELSAAEVVDVILLSAEDRGEVGVDDQYGRGFIRNAQQVLDNIIGPPVIPTPDPVSDAGGGGGGGGGGGAGAALLVGGAVVGAILLLRKRSNKLEKTLVLDSYGRTFQVDLSDQVLINDGQLELQEFFFNLDQKGIANGFDLARLNTHIEFSAVAENDYRFDAAEYFALPNDVILQDDQANLSFAFTSQLSQNIGFAGGYKVNSDDVYSGSSLLDQNEVFGQSSFISGQSHTSRFAGS